MKWPLISFMIHCEPVVLAGPKVNVYCATQLGDAWHWNEHWVVLAVLHANYSTVTTPNYNEQPPTNNHRPPSTTHHRSPAVEEQEVGRRHHLDRHRQAHCRIQRRRSGESHERVGHLDGPQKQEGGAKLLLESWLGWDSGEVGWIKRVRRCNASRIWCNTWIYLFHLVTGEYGNFVEFRSISSLYPCLEIPSIEAGCKGFYILYKSWCFMRRG